ncbi:MAG: hypothetical protein ABI178_02110 [Rhodanobacter sp.]
MHALQAPGVLLAYALLAVTAGVPPEGAATACKVEFDGAAFLQAAAQRGLEPEHRSECDEVSISDNRFYAPPLSSCELFFTNAAWLTAGARFDNVKGQGSFTAHVDPAGVDIKISPGGGFYLKKVTVAATVATASCKDVSIEDVLGAG